MASGITNKSFDCVKDVKNAGEDEGEGIYDIIDEESSEPFALPLEKEIDKGKANSTKHMQTQFSDNHSDNHSNRSNSVENGDAVNTGPHILPAKQRRSISSLTSHPYDEVTLNFGKPVLFTSPNHIPRENNGNGGEDIFDSVCFSSPIDDLNQPQSCASHLDRSNSQLSDGNETSSSFYYEKPKTTDSTNNLEAGEGDDIFKPVPKPRTSILVKSISQTSQYDNIETNHSSPAKTVSTTSNSDICDSDKGRYEDIDDIDYDSDDDDSICDKNQIPEVRTVKVNHEYSDVRDFALSLVDTNYDNDNGSHGYTDVAIVQHDTCSKVEVENILNVSQRSTVEEDKENRILEKYSKPLDALPSQILKDTSIDTENIYSEIETSSVDVTASNDTSHQKISLIDMPTEEQEEEDDILCQLGARPRAKPRSSLSSRSSTIDIRNEIAQWYDEASREVERDMSLDLDILENVGSGNAINAHVSDSDTDEIVCDKNEGHHIYEHVALQDPGKNCQLIDGKLVIQPKNPSVTLLRDFDPLLHGRERPQMNQYEGEELETSDDDDDCVKECGTESVHSSVPNEVDGASALPADNDLENAKKDGKRKNKSDDVDRTENIYSDSPVCKRKDVKNILDDETDEASDADSVDGRLHLPPPISPPPPPPPLPNSQPPSIPRRHVQYENVWLGNRSNGDGNVESSPSVSIRSDIAMGTSSPVPMKPPRPSINKVMILKSSPTVEDDMGSPKLHKTDSFSSEESEFKEDTATKLRTARQNSATSVKSGDTQQTNKGNLTQTLVHQVGSQIKISIML